MEIQQAIIGAITPGIVWAFFAAVLGIVGLISLIVVWHWSRYGKGVLRKVAAETVYLGVTTAIVVALFISCTVLIANL